ncbi:MAG: Fic family protein [Acidimicrobiia bacterium]|nr:Fic family protein [Acidimicrobiia bacterium]MYH06010.1 Fic family protein [Acidimicrobiia bacterium]MYK55894.1 Fic family protein [Acidimicrobiia bacterium]
MRIPPKGPAVEEILQTLSGDRAATILFSDHSRPSVDGRYYHWEELRRRPPPDGFSSKEWWFGVKMARSQVRRMLPFADTSGQPFSYVLTDEALSMLHRIDQQAAGRIQMPKVVTSSATRDRYIVAGLIEEAINSSLLEGAATTRRDAKELLRSGRSPRTIDERMVVNNYRTMQNLRRHLGTPLTVDMVLDIHRMLADGTLDRAEDVGRFQQSGEKRVYVSGPDPNDIYHRPPPADELPARMQKLVDFANGVEDQRFVHPVVRAIALHFQLAYIHPFVDGNGRTARALFYRSLLQHGYWLAEFLSISRLLYQAPVKYQRAFLYSETDDGDFTYFLLHQLDVLCRAIEDLFETLEVKVEEVRRIERALRREPDLNSRQLALLGHAIRNLDAVYTIQAHRTSHRVAYQTARTDLLDLEKRGFLELHDAGKQYRFFPVVESLEELIS